MRRGGTGGANTNKNGKSFEKNANVTKFSKMLVDEGFVFKEQDECTDWLEDEGVDLSVSSSKMKPDQMLIDKQNKRIYFNELKYQDTSGSADEKIKCGPINKSILEDYTVQLDGGYSIEYTYVLAEWYKKSKYITWIKKLRDFGIRVIFDDEICSLSQYKTALGII